MSMTERIKNGWARARDAHVINYAHRVGYTWHWVGEDQDGTCHRGVKLSEIRADEPPDGEWRCLMCQQKFPECRNPNLRITR